MAQNGVQMDYFDQVSIIDEMIGMRDGSAVRIDFNMMLKLLPGEVSGPTYETLAELTADLAWPDGAVAVVWGDEVLAQRGLYQKAGAEGSGDWTRYSDLPLSAEMLAESRDTNAGLLLQVQAAAAESNAPVLSRAVAEALSVDAAVERISVLHNGEVLRYIKDATGSALTTADGAKWAPDGLATFQHYGATGDGITDDAAAVLAALDAGHKRISSGGAVFSIQTPISPAPPASGERLMLDDMVIDVSLLPDQPGSPDVGIDFAGTQGAAVPLTADLLANTPVVTVGVGNTATFSEDQPVWLASDAIFEVSQSVTLGHLARVESIDAVAGTITLHTDALYPFLVADNATISPLNMAGQIVLGPGVTIKGARLNSQLGLRLHLCEDLVVMPGVSIEDCDYCGITVSRCLGGSFHAPTVRRAELVGTSYGFSLANGVRGLHVYGGHGEDLRHFVAGGDNDGVNVFITVEGCYLSGVLDAGLDCHGAGDYWSFLNNQVVASYTESGNSDGIIMQGNNVIMSGNTLHGFRRHSIFHQPLPVIGEVSTQITGNTIHSSGGSVIGEAAIYVQAANRRVRAVNIADNIWQGVSASEYFILVNAANVDVDRVAVHGNVMADDCTATIAAFRLITSGTAKVKSAVVANNILSADAGQIAYFDGSGGEITNVAFSGNALSSAVAGVEALRMIGVNGFTETGNDYNIEATSAVYNIDEATCSNIILDNRHHAERISTDTTLVVGPKDTFILINETGPTVVTLPPAAVYPGRIIEMYQTRADGAVTSASADVVPITEPTTAGTAILPATDGAWCRMRSNGTAWKIIAQG